MFGKNNNATATVQEKKEAIAAMKAAGYCTNGIDSSDVQVIQYEDGNKVFIVLLGDAMCTYNPFFKGNVKTKGVNFVCF